MKALRRTIARMTNFVVNRRGDDRLREEMEAHLAMQTEDNLRAGMSPEESQRQARLRFGAVEAVREQYHEEEGLPIAERLLQDVRYALRQLRRAPGFTVVAILTLAMGIGANAAIFSLLDAVLIRKLPVTNPKMLVRLGDRNDCCVGYGVRENGDYSVFSTDAWERLRAHTPEFEELAAMQAGFESSPIIVRRKDAPAAAHPATGEFVSGNYFKMLGLSPEIGRLLSEADDSDGAPATAVMSDDAWKNRYAGDPGIVGSTIYVNSEPVTIIGVAQPGFYGDRLSPTPPEFYLPIAAMPALANASFVKDPAAKWLYLIGRVKPGVSLPQLQTKVSGLLKQALAPIRTFATEPDRSRLPKVHVVLTRGGAGIRSMEEQYSVQLYLLMSISGLVLLIACANVANLLLVRGMARRAEMSVRTALGATHARLMRQLLTESILLGLLGGAAGVVVAYGGTHMLLSMAFPDASGMPIGASPSLAVLAFACALSVVTGMLFGVAPALMAARTEPIDALRSGSRTVAGGATIVQQGLVIAQAALSLVLLVSAGLFVQSLSRLQHVDLRLDATNRYIVHIDPQAAGYLPSQLGALYRNVEQRFHAVPGIVNVGISTYTPMELWNDGWAVQVRGRPELSLQASDVRINSEYFDSVGTRVVRGRGINVSDTASSTTVAVVNQAFVKKLFKPGEDPIGQHFGTSTKSAGDYEIVGVVDDTVYTSARWKDHPMYFLSSVQRPASDRTPVDDDYDLYARTIVLETARPITNLESLTRQTLLSINLNLAVVKFESLPQQIADQFTDDRTVERLSVLFAALALLLAMTGLYGVTAYSVSRRSSEIGIRIALGAERTRVVGMVIRGAMTQILVGLAIGLPCAVLCVHFFQSMLYEIKSVDPVVLLGAVLPLILAALIAAFVPARRAASIDPVQALRVE